MNPYGETRGQSDCHSPAFPTPRSWHLSDGINASIYYIHDAGSEDATSSQGCCAERLLNSPLTLFCLQAAQSSPNQEQTQQLCYSLLSDRLPIGSSSQPCAWHMGMGSFKHTDSRLAGLPLVMDGI